MQWFLKHNTQQPGDKRKKHRNTFQHNEKLTVLKKTYQTSENIPPELSVNHIGNLNPDYIRIFTTQK